MTQILYKDTDGTIASIGWVMSKKELSAEEALEALGIDLQEWGLCHGLGWADPGRVILTEKA